jgi:hypothetical protein
VSSQGTQIADYTIDVAVRVPALAVSVTSVALPQTAVDRGGLLFSGDQVTVTLTLEHTVASSGSACVVVRVVVVVAVVVVVVVVVVEVVVVVVVVVEVVEVVVVVVVGIVVNTILVKFKITKLFLIE